MCMCVPQKYLCVYLFKKYRYFGTKSHHYFQIYFSFIKIFKESHVKNSQFSNDKKLVKKFEFLQKHNRNHSIKIQKISQK